MSKAMYYKRVIDNMAFEGVMRASDGQFGLEIEMETRGEPPNGIPGWRRANDGSLRGESAEYVFTRPRDYDEAVDLIETLKKALSSRGVRINDSFRAGVHVHMNVQNKTYEEILAFLCMYYHVESAILDYCGDNRVGNMFCLGIEDAEAQVASLMASVNKAARNPWGPFASYPIDMLKYSAMNLAPMDSYGSIEFRGMQTYPDLHGIPELMKTFEMMWDKSKSKPLDVFEEYDKLGPLAYADRVLGDTPYAGALKHRNIVDMVRHNHATVLTLRPRLLIIEDKGVEVKKKKKAKEPMYGLRDGLQYIDEPREGGMNARAFNFAQEMAERHRRVNIRDDDF